MALILAVSERWELSTLRYAAWRPVIADRAAERYGTVDAMAPGGPCPCRPGCRR